MKGARRVQQKLFPSPLSSLIQSANSRGFDLAGTSYPVEAIGGDYFDFFRLDSEVDSIGVAIGDVSGHGIGSALLMALARSYLRASAQLSSCPGEVLARVNRLLAHDMEGDRYITLFLARIDLESRSVSYASAGHATAYILDGQDRIKHALTSTDVPLGIHPDGEFVTRGPYQLSVGDIVVLLTDGLSDARDPQRHDFKDQRVLDLVRCYRHATAGQIVENLYFAVRAYAHNLPQLDDITAVVIKICKK
jgi:sigma-B regulation protein RsbU (phosphoserine phosphatase)